MGKTYEYLCCKCTYKELTEIETLITIYERQSINRIRNNVSDRKVSKIGKSFHIKMLFLTIIDPRSFTSIQCLQLPPILYASVMPVIVSKGIEQ